MSFAGRITYNSINVDFVRQWNNFAVRKAQNQAISRSAARVRETLNFANQDLIRAVKERLTAQELAELLQFYEFAKDGSSFIFLRDRDLGAYWNFEKTLNNNDENALTFTRAAGTASNASYIDPSTGFITFEDTINTPRYGSGKYGHGLVIEGARTNFIQNQGMDHANWVKTNFTVSDNDTAEIIDPAGGNNADKITAAANNGNAVYTGPAVSTDDGVFPVYIACPSGTVEGEIIIRDGSAVVVTTVPFTATPEWQRIQAVYENVGDPSDNFELVIRIDTSGDIIYVFGPQGEAGADVLFASNFILTAGGTKTRNAERAILAPTNIIGNEKGTIMLWFKPEFQIFNKHASQFLYSHADSGGGDIHSKIVIDSTGRLECTINDTLGNAVTALASITSVFTVGEWAHIAMTYDSTISNGVKAYYDGALLATSTNDAFVPKANQDFFNIGTNRIGGFHAFGVFDEKTIRKDVLPGSMIAQVAAQGVGLGEIRNRWPSVALSNPDFLEEQLKGINRYNYILDMEELISA